MTSSGPDHDPVGPPGPGQMLGESDWDDEDLLTISEASERLATEVSRARQRARMLQELLDNPESLPGDPDEVRAEILAETRRADELAAAALRIRRGQANPPVPR